MKRVQEAFRHHDSVMVQMPTGTGKTHVLVAIVEMYLKKYVWVVAHRRELVSQIKDTLARFFLTWIQRNPSDIHTMVVKTLSGDKGKAESDCD